MEFVGPRSGWRWLFAREPATPALLDVAEVPVGDRGDPDQDEQGDDHVADVVQDLGTPNAVPRPLDEYDRVRTRSMASTSS